MGLFMWLNFQSINAMYIYWPAVLIGLTVFILFLPARVLFHRSRKWFAFSNVSPNVLLQLRAVTDKSSGAFYLPGYTLLNSVISSWVICIVHRSMRWV